MAKSETPMTDAVTRQYDEWDKQIDELKNSASEWAKEQLEALEKDIKAWAKKKEEELKEDKQSENPTKDLTPPKDLDDCVKKLAETIDALQKVAKMVIQTLADTGGAIGVITSRTPQTLAKIASATPTTPSVPSGGVPTPPIG